MREDTTKRVVDKLMGGVNCFSINHREVAERMAREHRTLQQSFTKICVEWLKVLAEMEHYDERNRASVEFAKKLMQTDAKEVFDEARLPMI